MNRIRPPFKTSQSKYFLCPWIIETFPANYRELTYIEPYGGGASVLLNKEPSKMEVFNDLDERPVQIFRALRDEPKEFMARLKRVKYSADSFNKAAKKAATPQEDYLDQAVNEFILRRMSHNGGSRMFASEKIADANAWKTSLEQLPKISNRLQQVHIFNKPALEIIKAFNSTDSLIYCDPSPSLLNRQNKAPFEMDNDDHTALSKALHSFLGKVVVSGQGPIFNKLYKGWNMQKKRVVGKNDKVRVEVLWKNF